jgi:uncharacterized membrane protein YhhN
MSDTTAAPPAARWPAALAIRNRTAAVLLGIFGLLVVVNLVGGAATAGTGGVRLSDVFTKPLLMLALAGFVAAARPARPENADWAPLRQAPRPSRLTVGGLLLGGVGDAALLGHGTWFLVRMGAFALGHACYLTAFLRRGAAATLRRRWWVPVGYLAVWAALIALVWPGLETGLRVPVLVYSLLLTAMAATAAGTGRLAGIGGALFLVSDGTLALGMADVDFPGRGAVVMPTYLAAQLLIALALLPAAPERGSVAA